MAAGTVELALVNLSGARKAGLKGPNAAAWLGTHGIDVPREPNTWLRLSAGGLVGRLAETEFFLEDADGPGPAATLHGLAPAMPPGVYGVPREDHCLGLAGRRIHEVLLQVCSVNFQGQPANRLFMTSMAGVAVLALRDEHPGFALMRIWADPTFGPYLRHTLEQIVRELGGHCAEPSALFSESNRGGVQ